MYDTEVYLPSFPPVPVNEIPKKYRPIPNRNTDSGCNYLVTLFFWEKNSRVPSRPGKFETGSRETGREAVPVP